MAQNGKWGRQGNNQTLLGFRLIKKYLHILQQICLIQNEHTRLLYDYRPSVQFSDIPRHYSSVENSGRETAQTS